MRTERIIIDTDPGIDDALALAYSYCAGLPVGGITTVYGNATLDNVTRNAGYIVRGLGSKWEIYRGKAEPLSGTAHVAQSHGGSGLGNISPKDSEITEPSQESANNFLKNLPRDKSNTIFCFGPLTNIASAFLSDRSFGLSVKNIIIMGGAFSEKGNVTEYSEFNIYNDPEALRVVIEHAERLSIDLVIIPVEVCRNVTLTPNDLNILEKNSVLPNLRSIVEPFIEYYVGDQSYGGYKGAVLYDVLVPLYYQHPELFTSVRASVKVESNKKEHYGQTTYIENSISEVRVCIKIDSIRAKESIMTTLEKF